ncbi:hypothetical protein ASG59_14050 [Methylobacterium sp. Leaf466]|nr:hypothetical protein ASG59_14050 [Methylobacterium sp. Leaf466]
MSAHPSDAGAGTITKVPPATLGLLGLQHGLAMDAGAVAVPLIVGRALGLAPEQARGTSASSGSPARASSARWIIAANRNNLFIVAVSVGFGLIPLVAPNLFKQMLHPLLESGILLAAICAVVLTLFFDGLGDTASARAERSRVVHAA